MPQYRRGRRLANNGLVLIETDHPLTINYTMVYRKINCKIKIGRNNQ